MKGLSLFSGIGGLDLAFNWTGGEIMAFCEIEPFCQRVLRKHWPSVPIFSDIHGLTKEVMKNEGLPQTVDVVYGGFPCQPFSVAGLKKGRDDSRYLWPEFVRVVREVKPRWVVGENVPGILRISADTVCTDLEREGYSVGIWDFEAVAVGAPHRRERVFFVAHTDSARLQGSDEPRDLRTETERGLAPKSERPSSAYMANANSVRELQPQGSVEEQRGRADDCCEETAPAPNERLAKSGMGGVFDGISCGLDGSRLTYWQKAPEPERIVQGTKGRGARLRALGNAVVPQQAYPIFKAIMEAEHES